MSRPIVNCREFRAEDLAELRLETAPEWVRRSVAGGLDRWRELETGRALLSWTARSDGRTLVCGGVRRRDIEGHGLVWMIVADAVPLRAWPAVTRKARDVLEHAQRGLVHSSGLWRLEAAVDCRFPVGVGWLGRLGFEMVGKAMAWLPDGGDVWLFERVRWPGWG